jgi:hypothetical protein
MFHVMQDVGAKLKDKFKTPHDEYTFHPYAKKAEVSRNSSAFDKLLTLLAVSSLCLGACQ